MNKILEDISKWPLQKREDYLRASFLEKMGRPLDLENPQSFSEMIQWIKLYYHDPIMTQCVDKVTFKDYVREVLGSGYTAKTWQVWESPDEVDLQSIPERCAVKSNCSSDGCNILLVTGQGEIDLAAAEKDIKENWFDRRKLHTNSFANYYYGVNPKVFVEELMDESDDYDILCFHGEPKFVYVKTEHFDNGRNIEIGYPVSFFTVDWKYMDVKYSGYQTRATIKRPAHLQEMLDISKKLSKDFPFVRVDFFESAGKLYVAEFSFSPWAGLRPYEPDTLDYEMGKWLDILHTARPEYVSKTESCEKDAAV